MSVIFIIVTRGIAFTVTDAKFLHLVTSDQSYHGHDRPFVDPFQADPVLQRLAIMTQLVNTKRKNERALWLQQTIVTSIDISY